jgi:hypothetical protein
MPSNRVKEKNMHIFISHATQDDAFVKHLRENLELRGLTVWVDSRYLTGGDKLKPKIFEAIEAADAFIFIISSHTFFSSWVLDETRHALNVKKKVIPILLDDANPNALKYFFIDETLGIKIDSSPGGIDNAMPDILAALDLKKPNDPTPDLDIDDKPVEDLTLILTNPFLKTMDKVTRAAAEAKLVYKPSSGAPEVESDRFVFIAPIGPIEHEDLRWYLEEYFRWPATVFQKRAKEIEQNFPKWGHDIYKAAAYNDGLVRDWLSPHADTNLRFTAFVDPKAFDPQLSDEEAQKRQAEADQASTLILGLPWELLHDGGGYLFQGARPVYIRRRMPNKITLKVAAADPPVRILLVSPRR